MLVPTRSVNICLSPKCRFIIPALILLAFCSLQARAQEYRPLLGKADKNTPVKKTPRYAIPYKACGFDKPKMKAVEKSKRWLNKRKAGHLGDDLEQFAGVAGNESQISEWIDAAYEKMRDKYLACGGKWAETARNFNPRSLMVTIEEKPFRVYWQGEWIWAGGYYDGNDRTIRAVITGIFGMSINPPEAWFLTRLPDYLEWEMGNGLGFASGEKQEMGDHSPCGK